VKANSKPAPIGPAISRTKTRSAATAIARITRVKDDHVVSMRMQNMFVGMTRPMATRFTGGVFVNQPRQRP
jgi:hypothetical protein